VLPKPHPIYDIIQPTFQQLQQIFTGRATAAGCFFIVVEELPLQHPIGATQFLLFPQLQAIVGQSGTACAMLARRSFQITFGLYGPGRRFQKQIHAFPAA
jgi:hypothetical protein